jgi:hypothetical protein
MHTMPSVKRNSERPSDTSHWLSAGCPASGADTFTPMGPSASLKEFSVVSCRREQRGAVSSHLTDQTCRVCLALAPTQRHILVVCCTSRVWDTPLTHFISQAIWSSLFSVGAFCHQQSPQGCADTWQKQDAVRSVCSAAAAHRVEAARVERDVALRGDLQQRQYAPYAE